MTQELEAIFDLEDAGNYEQAFNSYAALYNDNRHDYEVWKHFYFFLWLAIEDTPSIFHVKINLRHLLQEMYIEGKLAFSGSADFNFVAGYTIHLFPYEYGDYLTLEDEARRMLQLACKLDPSNVIYKMVFLGTRVTGAEKEYKALENEAAPYVLKRYCGKGALNKYFRQVLYRARNNSS
jgi:hypothetical protein